MDWDAHTDLEARCFSRAMAHERTHLDIAEDQRLCRLEHLTGQALAWGKGGLPADACECLIPFAFSIELEYLLP